MNNNSLPELKAFKRAPCLGLSQWENGNLTTNRAQLVLVRTQPNPVPSLGLPNSGFSLRIHLNKNHENIEI